MGEAAHERANSEKYQRQDQEKGPAKYVAKGGDEGHGDGIGKQVRGADPEPLGCRAIQVDHDILLQMVRSYVGTKRDLTCSQRGNDDAGVERDHQRHQREHHHDHEFVSIGTPIIMLACGSGGLGIAMGGICYPVLPG